jgi:4-amino-4-deoxy-L-arabinose transferase-like glycosyltransferase
MSRHARATEPPAPGVSSASRLDPHVAVAVVLGALFIAIALPVLGTLPHDFDEAWLVLDARFIHRGLRPFVDFAHHETPLHLYLLTASGELFGRTLFGYRMVSLVSLTTSGFLLFWLARPFVGPTPALIAQAVFLFSAVQARSLTAVPETPALLFTLVGAVLLFVRDGRWSARASGLAFVTALLIKPTCLVVALAAALSLAYARAWRRLADFAAAGTVAALAGLAWVILLSDGIFAEVLRFQLARVGTHRVGMWAIDSGFTDMRRLGGIETPRQWAVVNFKSFFLSRVESTPVSIFVLALLAIPLWVRGCARSRPAFQAFVVLWPASYLLLNFVVMDFVSPRYFIAFFAFSAFLCAGWAWLAERVAGRLAVAAVGAIVCVALVSHLASTLGSDSDPWVWGRSDWIAHEYPRVVSFSPILFAATGAEPGCGFANSALTYGPFGEAFLLTERTRRFRFDDERLIACLRANPDIPVVVDWAFYFFTRPGSRLREYLAGEGSAQRLFFSPDAVEQWDRPLLRMSPLR